MTYLKKALPHIVALVIFASISALFFAPQYSGEALRQGDMVQASGMGQDILEHKAEQGEHPQWAGRMFGGMPAYLIDMDYQGRWIKDIADQSYILGQPASFLFIAMCTFYLMLLMFGVNPWIAIIGGISYGLSTYFPIIIGAGHITKMMALAWIPAVIGSVYYAYRKGWLLGSALAGLFLSIEISTSHPQITYYFGFVVLALFINEFIRAYREKILKKFGLITLALFGAALLAIGSNAVQLYYVSDYAKESTRSRSELTAQQQSDNSTSGLDKDYATQWSYGKSESFNLFIPNFAGGGRNFSEDGEVSKTLTKYNISARDIGGFPSYHGTQPFTEGPVYVGAVMMFLMLFGMFYLSGGKKWWIFGVSLLALFLAWGHNMNWLTNLFLDRFPLYNKFRTVSMILVILEWSIPLVAVLALNKLYNKSIETEPITAKNLENSDAKFVNSLKYSLVIAGGFALFSALILPIFMDFSAATDQEMPSDLVVAMHGERASMLRLDSLRTLFFIAVTAVVLWLFYKKRIKAVVMIGAIALLTTIDLYSVDRRFISKEDFMPVKQAKAINPTPADLQILNDKGDYRVANFTLSLFQDATTSYFHRSVGGYHAAKLRRYQDVIDHHLSKQNMAVYDMLNTRYFITKEGVMENEYAMGSAWFVSDIEWVETPDHEIASLGEGFEPYRTAVVDRRFLEMIGERTATVDSTAEIWLTQYKVNHLTYRYQTQEDGIAVFSEIYYPKGWQAYIDGKEAESFRANYILRAMKLPAGEHTVEWRFAAPHFSALVNTTRISSSLLLVLTATGILLRIRRPNKGKRK